LNKLASINVQKWPNLKVTEWCGNVC